MISNAFSMNVSPFSNGEYGYLPTWQVIELEKMDKESPQVSLRSRSFSSQGHKSTQEEVNGIQPKSILDVSKILKKMNSPTPSPPEGEKEPFSCKSLSPPLNHPRNGYSISSFYYLFSPWVLPIIYLLLTVLTFSYFFPS